MTRRGKTRIAVLLLLGVAMAAPTFAYSATKYIHGVRSGDILTCKWVKLAVDRHVQDLERVGNEDFPFYFDENEAIRAIKFIELLRHTKGEWADQTKHDTRIRLEPWQQFIVWNLFGWRQNADGCRRYNKAYIEVARKNGKTTFAAAILNYCYLADSPREVGAEAYTVATKRDQAKIAWGEAERQIRRHPTLASRTKTYKQNSTVVVKGTPAILRPLGQDSDTEDGLNPHVALIDEYHAHPSNEMVGVIQSGMGSRRQPLILIITTAGFDRNAACYQEEHTLTEKMLEGALDPSPETYFGIIYTIDTGDDWQDREVWIKSNPNLGVSVKWEYLEDQIREAILVPRKQNNVKTKNLNIWTNAFSRWLSSEMWDRCASDFDESDLEGRIGYGGLDLSTNIDITAFVLTFPPEEPETRYRSIFRFFIPEENVREREERDRVPYSAWIEAGYIHATPGNVIDYDYIEEVIRADADRFDIQEIAYDPWNATEIINHLQDDGLEFVTFRQGYASMSPAAKDYEKRIRSGELEHGGNPVMNWMVSCVEVKQDPAGNIKPVKPDRRKTGKRIDGVVGHIMSLSRAVWSETGFHAGAVAI